jgi:bla regulator protein BlaR1
MTGWLSETFVATTLLMLVALALRGPVARMFGARWAYALWLVPALRVILPPLPALLPQPSLPPVVVIIPATAQLAAPHPAEIAANWEWMPFLMALWAGGAVIFLVLQWLDYRDFLNRLAGAARPAAASVSNGVKMLISAEVEGPVAFGLLHRKIVVPADFAQRYSPAEQRLAIEHELIHHRRGDLWCNFTALIILAFNWFNPVAWLAFQAFRNDQELACDEAVAARASVEERHEYASALVKSASRPGLIAVCPLTRVGQLKHRLRMMRNHRISPLRSLGGGASISAIAAGAFVLGTPGFSHQAERAIVYRTASAPAPAQLVKALPYRPANPIARLARERTPARRHISRLARPVAERAEPAPPVVVAAATPLDIREASLKLPQVPRVQLPPAPRVPHAPVYHLYDAAITAQDVQSAGLSRENAERVVKALSRLQSGEHVETRTVDTVTSHLRGLVMVKVVASYSRED